MVDNDHLDELVNWLIGPRNEQCSNDQAFAILVASNELDSCRDPNRAKTLENVQFLSGWNNLILNLSPRVQSSSTVCEVQEGTAIKVTLDMRLMGSLLVCIYSIL